MEVLQPVQASVALYMYLLIVLVICTLQMVKTLFFEKLMEQQTYIVSTIVGNHVFGYTGYNGPATSASISVPLGVTLSSRILH